MVLTRSQTAARVRPPPVPPPPHDEAAAVVCVPLAVYPGPPIPSWIRYDGFGFRTDLSSPVVRALRPIGACRAEVQAAVCRAMQLDLFQIIGELLAGSLPREIAVYAPNDGATTPVVIWYAIDGMNHLFPLDISDWVLPGGVAVCDVATIKASRVTRAQAFEDLVCAIEECREDLPDIKFRALYDGATRLHQVLRGTSDP